MRRRTTSTAPALQPALNLLSPWVLEELRVRRLRGRFALGGLALVLALAGGWTFQRLELAGAQADLRGEEAVAAGLGQRIADLGDVRTYVQGVGRRALTVQQAMRTEVAFSDVLQALDGATPRGARIDSVSVVLPEPTAADPATAPVATPVDPAADPAEDPRGLVPTACPGPDPFATRVVIGCLDLSGTAATRDQVGRLVVALGRNPLFVEPFVSTTTASDGSGVAFTGSVALSPAAFSGRFDELPALLGGDAS